MAQEQVEIIKRELEQSLERNTEKQNPLNNLVQGLKHKLELSQNFFLDNNLNCSQQQQQQEHFIPTKIKSRNFLTNTSYNRFKHMDFNNASFIIDCFTNILVNLNSFSVEQNF